MENQSPAETTAGACVDQVPVVECTKIILIRHQVLFFVSFEVPYIRKEEFFSDSNNVLRKDHANG